MPSALPASNQDLIAQAVLREAGQAERLVSKVRAVFAVMSLVGAISVQAAGYLSDVTVTLRALAFAGLSTAWAVGWLLFISRRPYRPAMGYASVLLDSALIFGVFLLDPPDGRHDPLQRSLLVSLALGASPMTLFLFFLLATSALRQEPRLCLLGAASAAILHGLAVIRAMPSLTPDALQGLLDPSFSRLFWSFRTAAFLLTVAVVALATQNGRRMAVSAGRAAIEQARLLNVFGKYVDPEVARSALAGTSSAETREVTVLFTDLRDFTHLSELHSPSEVLELLNAHCAAIVPVAHKHGGTVNKFIGDALMATFGAPVACADHAERAVRAGLEMIEATDRLNARLRAQGRPELHMGVGIASGPVVVGPLGATERMEYAVIGDTVNVASRLEGMNKQLGSQLLLSDRTRAALGPEFHAQALGEVELKGKERPVPVYTIAAPPGARSRVG